MSKLEEMRLTSLGQIALQVLRRNPSAMVTGRSRQGIYLLPRGDLTLYLSSDPFRGPLTMNAQGNRDALLGIQAGDICDFKAGEITFLDASLAVRIDRPLVWKPAEPLKFKGGLGDRLRKLARQAQSVYPGHPYLDLLDIPTTEEPVQLQGFPGVGEQITHLSRSLAAGDLAALFDGIEPLIGAGPGLTPLGDDFILGALLAFSRARVHARRDGDWLPFTQAVLSAAEEKTTRLSWSLLCCAAQGTADERIIRVLDSLIAGREIPDQDLDSLLRWGSSSGIAVLAGMIASLA